MSTLSDIAQMAGVSTSTVFRVLNGQSSASLPEEAKARILEAAARLDYQPRTRRRSIGANKVRKLAVIGMNSEARDSSIPYFHDLTLGIQRECASRGLTGSNLQLIWSDAIRSYSQFEDFGQIIVVANNLDAAEFFRDKDQQVVFVAASPDPHRFPSVRVDLAGGTRLAVQHLIGLGYRKVGYFGEATEQDDQFSRFSTFKYLLTKLDLYDPQYVNLNGHWTAQSGYQMAKQAMQTGLVARSYFIANDPMAIGAIRAFASEGYRVPEDVAIIGFDNIELSAYTQPPLTTIDDSSAQCARLAVNLVVDGLCGSVPLIQVLVPTHLVIRESCGFPHTT